VNSDFGAIFAELLPGNFVKLQPPDNQDLMDGLEIKVQLVSVWRQSLTELSGGQRSLIALSLIMALFQFKPAPMACTSWTRSTQHWTSRTRNTLARCSAHGFARRTSSSSRSKRDSSRTRFRNCTSIVERTAQRGNSSLYNHSECEREEGTLGGEAVTVGVPRRARQGAAS